MKLCKPPMNLGVIYANTDVIYWVKYDYRCYLLWQRGLKHRSVHNIWDYDNPTSQTDGIFELRKNKH